MAAEQAAKPHPRGKALAKAIDELLAEPDAARGFWGIYIVSLDSGRVLYELNTDKLFTPASNTKLFTTVAAFQRLGPDFRFRTTLETAAHLDASGRLNGDLVLVGRGDPNLSSRVLPYDIRSQFLPNRLSVLEKLADEVVTKGVKEIAGDVVGDDSYFAFQRFAEGWSQDDLMWPSGAPASALSVADNEQTIAITPAPSPGLPAMLRVDPDVPYYEIDNRVITTVAGTGPRAIGMDRQPGSKTVVLWGTIPLDDAGANYTLAIDDPAAFAAQAFASLLQTRGVKITGKQRAQHMLTAALPLNALKIDSAYEQAKGGGAEPPLAIVNTAPPMQVLAQHESEPLFQDLRVVNKVSQNVHAEILLRTLGRERGVAPTVEAGRAVVREVMEEIGIMPEEFVLFDGSGLSAQNMVSPRALVTLLTYAEGASWGPLFRETLAVGGEDGTLYDRMRGSPAQGRFRGKTGTLAFVNTLAGYAQTVKKEERLAIAIMTNHHRLNSSGAKRVIDRIVELAVDDAPKPVRRRKR